MCAQTFNWLAIKLKDMDFLGITKNLASFSPVHMIKKLFPFCQLTILKIILWDVESAS
jgi:hypothetical protein